MKLVPVIHLSILASFVFTSASFSEEEKAVYLTNMDFEGTLIDGKMKAPAGFFLQGVGQNQLENMVKLRENFGPEIKSSAKSVRSIVR